MIYLASPYSHSDPTVREARFQAACRAAAELIREGHIVYSPIAHSHPIARYGLPLDWEFWAAQDRTFLRLCDELWVLPLDGWKDSLGVQAEIQLARLLGKPIRFLPPMSVTNADNSAPVSTSPSQSP